MCPGGQIGPFQSTTSGRSKLKVKARLNLHGIISIESATLLEEEEFDVSVAKESTKMDTDEATKNYTALASTNETDVNMQDAKGSTEAPGAENGIPESEHNPVQMETDVKIDASKRKVKKTNIPVTELVYGGMTRADVQKAVEKEFEMALHMLIRCGMKAPNYALHASRKLVNVPRN